LCDSEEAYHKLRVKAAENAAAALRGRYPKYLFNFNPEVKANARLRKRREPQGPPTGPEKEGTT
jgi:hypothetical protein